MLSILFIISVSVYTCIASSFPAGFKFGAGHSAYQAEGAWNVSDKGLSIWDTFAHKPGKIVDNSTGDIAADSYHRWKEDIQMAIDLGLHTFRFSICWPRLLPQGFDNYISDDGKKHYSDLIDELLKHGIEPIITLYHWDLPQSLQDLGGWANPLSADWFEDFAKVVFSLYADRVKIWTTINEPFLICDTSYVYQFVAPGVYSPDIGNYLCTKNLLIAHAKVWRLYDKEFKPKYGGKVAIVNQIMWLQAATEADKEITELCNDLMVYRFIHPIYSKEGGWPPNLVRFMAESSNKKGYARSILPSWTKEEMELVKGTYDYFGFNYYTSRVVRKAVSSDREPAWFVEGLKEINAIFESHPTWKLTSNWIFIYPEGIRLVMRKIEDMYGNMEFMIMENGYSTSTRDLYDVERVQYLRDHLQQVHYAIYTDNINVTSYTAWTLLDNFEWMSGYSSKFGLYDVDFEDPQRKRTPRASAKYYAQTIKHNSYDVDIN